MTRCLSSPPLLPQYVAIIYHVLICLLGTYTRTTAIDAICRTFINSLQESSSHPPHRPLNFHGIQIISLGAGSDTRFFRLRRLHHHEDIRYREFDFPENTTEKIARIMKPEFIERVKQKAHLGMDGGWVEVLDEGRRLRSGMYCVTPLDLRTLAEDPGKAAAALEDVDPSLPTLLISECCLCYLSPEHADAVLKYFTDLFPATTPLTTVIYEPIRPFDSFGRTMVSNLTGRGIQLQTLERYADLGEQRERLRRYGFGGMRGCPGTESADKDAREDGEDKGLGEGGAEAADIDFIWREWVSDDEKERVEKLEWMDEVEEFVLLGKHYCVSWGWRGFADEAWKGLQGPK